MFCFSCATQDDETIAPNEPPIGKIDTLSYLALGDSYTIGQGVDTSFRWPLQLADSLLQFDFVLSPVDIIAKTGWRTDQLMDAMVEEEVLAYDLVSLLIGVNNQFQNQPIDNFKTDFGILLDRCIDIVGTTERVFVVSIPDYGVTPFGSSNSEQIAQELDEYNAFMAQVCTDLNIPFINITEISRELGATEGALASDNLHPSGMQYSKWVQEMLPQVLNLFN